MAGIKTKFTGASVAGYIASRANTDQQRADCKQLMSMFSKITGKRAKMWGPSIVGFGSYKYTYDSGHSGEAALGAFAIRGRDLVVYVLADEDKLKPQLAKLGKHRMGKSCLYFRQLADLDKSVLERIVSESIADVKRRYGARLGASN
ncbi:MAG TPA: DUF1801 domain-containing protein [Gemmatimonadaceae bacterium]|nr:DUF1801 domain-containing protein [Gemmatimonadaceae bacterium]